MLRLAIKEFIIILYMKKVLVTLISLCVLFFGVQTVLAQKDYGLDDTAKTAFGEEKYNKDKNTTPAAIIGNVIGAILTMVGVLFLVLMIYGGILWMTARGNEQQSQKALNTILAAVIGLVIVLGSYAFTNFIFTNVSGGGDSGSCTNAATWTSPCVSCSGLSQTACTNAGSACCVWQ